MVFAPERDGPDGALDRIVVEFDTAVVEEADKGWPARERITNGLGQSTPFRRSRPFARRSTSTFPRIARLRCIYTWPVRRRGCGIWNGFTITSGSNTCCSTGPRWLQRARYELIPRAPAMALRFKHQNAARYAL